MTNGTIPEDLREAGTPLAAISKVDVSLALSWRVFEWAKGTVRVTGSDWRR